eukprot:gene4991-5650_t
MAEGVEEAIVIVPFLSSKYDSSENCMRELNYAADHKKRIVPVILDESYKRKGPSGLIISGKLYIDFSDELRFDSNIKALKREIDAALGKQLPPTSKNRDSEKKEESLLDSE